MTRKITGIAIISGAALLAACQVLAGIERVHKVDEETLPESDGGTSSGKPDSGVPDPCQHVAPPPAPSSKTDPSELPAFYLATNKLSLVKPADNNVAGYDLDGACTCDPRKGTARDGGSSCTPKGSNPVKCDADGGIDNQGSALFQLFYDQSGKDLDEQFNTGSQDGAADILLFIKGWNGQKDDLDVAVGLFVSAGKSTDSTRPGDDPVPGHFGTWTHPSTVQTVDGPMGLGSGYVSNGVLVVQNVGVVKVLFGGAGLTFNDAVIIGDLSRDPASQATKFVGIVGGRIRDEELLAAAGQVATKGGHACDDPGLFNLIKIPICLARDIGHAAQADFKGAECDSISSAVSVTAVDATVADETKDIVDDGTNTCRPAVATKADPNIYKCDSQ